MPSEAQILNMEQARAARNFDRPKQADLRLPNGTVPLKKLSGKHLRLINLHTSGIKGDEIAAILGLTRPRVSAILNDPLVQAEIQRRYIALDQEMFAKSISVVSEAMDGADKSIALRAADMVWKARDRYAPKGNVAAATAEDIVQKMLAIAKERGTASVTISASAGAPTSTDPAGPLFEIEGEVCE
jgi:hypothetical protein